MHTHAYLVSSLLLIARLASALPTDPTASQPSLALRQDNSYQQAQSQMFEAQMEAQNEMQSQTTEEESAQKMNDAAWGTASSAPADKIQRDLTPRQDIGSETESYEQAQAQMFQAEMQAQSEMQQTTEQASAQKEATSR